MKKLILIISLLSFICLKGEEDKSKYILDNLKIEPIDAKNNGIGLNITYLIGSDKKTYPRDRINIITKSSKKREDISYELKNEDIKNTFITIKKLGTTENDVKINTIEKEKRKIKNKNNTKNILGILNDYGKKMQKKYGSINKDFLIVQEDINKKDNIVIIFGGDNGRR